MTEFETPKARLLFVKVADEYGKPYLVNSNPKHLKFVYRGGFERLWLPQGNWQLFNPFSISEEEAFKIMGWQYFPNELSNTHPVNVPSSLEHFEHLLNKLEIWKENPLGESDQESFLNKGSGMAKYNENYYKWQAAQERTGNWVGLVEFKNGK